LTIVHSPTLTMWRHNTVSLQHFNTSSLYLQDPTIDPYAEPGGSTPSSANLPKIHSDPVLPWSSKWTLSFGLSQPKSCTRTYVSTPTCYVHLTLSSYFGRSTNYEVLHCATSSILPSPHPSEVQIFFSEPCSQTPSVYALPLA
jgi:hypothetical protein